MIARRLTRLFAAACLAFALPTSAATFTVNSLADPGSSGCNMAECTLREAIASASGAAGADTIDFSVTGTITLGTQLLINFNDLTIDGPGPNLLTISGNSAVRVFRLVGTTNVLIRDLTVRNGNSNTDSNTSGGGFLITNGGDAVLENLRVIQNQGSQGAGIQVFFAGATIRQCEVAENTGLRNVGIGINGGTGNTVLVENTTISGNTGNQGESGIGVAPNTGQAVTLRYVTVAGNSGSPFGALLGGLGGTVAVESSIFADNNATNTEVQFGSNTTVNNTIAERALGTLVGSNNIVGSDPGLLSLRFVGNSVSRVHPFSVGIARNFVANGVGAPLCGTGVTRDQVGNFRPDSQRCDAGAFEVPQPGLAATWTFDEFAVGQVLSAGARVDDTSGNARDAHAETAADMPTTIAGRLGGTALAFQPTADRVVFENGFAFGDGGPPASSDIEFAQNDSFTLEALVRIPNGSAQVGAIMAKDVAPGTASWWFQVNNGRLEGQVSDGPNEPKVVGTRLINDGQWHHVAFVRDAIANQLRVFVDRQLDASTTDTTVGNSFTNNNILLGAFNNGTRNLDGAIDLARITYGVLDTTEFVQVPLGPNLAVDINDGVSTVTRGALVDYTVTITNSGDETANQAVLTNTLPPEITGTTWACSAQGGATCTATGGGALVDTVSVPVGGVLTYDVSASITLSAFASVTYTVSIATNGIQPEQVPANNTDTDVNFNENLLRDGFEDVAGTFNVAAGKMLADLSKLDTSGLGPAPRPISRSVDGNGATIGWIHIRRIDGNLQVRVSHKAPAELVWTVGGWTNVPAEGRTTLAW